MTEAAKRLRARAQELRATAAKHEVAFGARADCCAEFAADVCDELAAELDALPAEPVPLWLPSDALADAESFLRTANEEARSWPGMKSHAASLARHIVQMFKERPAEFDALPAEPVGAVESACAFLDGCNADCYALAERRVALAMAIIAEAAKRGWTPPAEPERSGPRCTCGSGAHPRPCMLHPHAYAEHILALNEETIRAEVRCEVLRELVEAHRAAFGGGDPGSAAWLRELAARG